MDRRTFLAAGAAAAALPAFTVEVLAHAYPNKPIRIVVGYPAGGQTDIIARTYGEYISRQLGQPVVVENKAGAGGILGAVEVKRAAPDGYTLMVTISTTMIQNRVTVKNLPYDADKDFVSRVADDPDRPRDGGEREDRREQPEGVRRVREEDRQGEHGQLCGGLRPRT